jgi:hypothetical protein
LIFLSNIQKIISNIDITKSCDCVLWAGDMNFRIDMSYQEVLEYSKENNYYELLLKDEFRMVQKKNGKLNSCKNSFYFLFYSRTLCRF